MSQITVAWRASEKLQKREYAETGERPDARRKFQLDLVNLGQEQRKSIVEYLGLHCFTLDMQATHDFNEKWPTSSYLPSYSQDYDRQPTLRDILSYVALETDARNEAQAHEAKVSAAKKANQERLQATYDKLRPKVDTLVEAGDLTALETFSLSVKAVANFKPYGGPSSLSKLLQAGIKAARKAKRESNKTIWIEAHGSSYLKRAFAGGYGAQRLYVTERAEMEARSFVVDFNNRAEWKDRPCPSPEALDIEAEAKKLELGDKAYTVWLTNPAVNRVDGEEERYYVFDPCEAVVVRGYLGQYDLVKVL